MKSTLKDIAERTGVSIATVSNVVNHRPMRISEGKRQEILAVAKELDYQVNQTARALVTRRSGLLALIVPDIENPYFSRLAKYLETLALERGQILIILNSHEQVQSDLNLLDVAVNRQVDGIFLIPSFESFADDRLQKKIKTLSVPLILLDRVYSELTISQVYFDNASGAYQAIRHLLDAGHRHIGIIAPPPLETSSSSRVQGYTAALTEAGAPLDDRYIQIGDYSYQSGYEAGKILLATDVSAIFSCNDRMTLGLLKALREAGRTVPRDLSLISNDSLPDDFTYGQPITTVVQDVAALAKAAYEAYCSLLNDHAVTKTVLMPTLIQRDSVNPR